jgi:tight adherence protein C
MMGWLSPLAIVAVALSSLTLAAAVALIVPPTRRLAGRVRPYTVTARTSLGRSADVRAVATPHAGQSTLRRLFGPLVEGLAARFGRYLDATSEAGLLLKLHQASMLTDVAEHRRAQEYRVRQLLAALAGATAALLGGALLGMSPSSVVALIALGFVLGAARFRATLDRTIEERRERMRIELYTVNQLMAMNVRVGGGVIQAVRRVVDRGNGALVDELAEVLRAHESGTSAKLAFTAAAARTPEPFVARTYRLLGAGAEFGADLAEALLDHSEDIREARREALKRTATKRRAGMLIPIIAILAPVMLLFIAAPIPSVIFGAQ